MKHSDLVAALNTLAGDLSGEFEAINWGGCGAMAAMVGKHLERMGLVCDVATPEYAEPAGRVRNKVGDRGDVTMWDSNGISRGHVAIRFRLGPVVKLWDSDHGVVDSLKRWSLSSKTMGQGLSVQECDWISNTNVEGNWNSSFDRDQLPGMQCMVDDALSVFDDGCFSGIQGNRLLQFLFQRNPQVCERRC